VPELFEIPGPGADARGRAILDDLFRAQLTLEGWERRRRFCARLVIILSAPLAFCVWRDVGFADLPARFGFLLWSFAFTAWGVSVAASLVAARSLDRLVAQAGGRRVVVDGGEGG
jgi:hypothetical protein